MSRRKYLWDNATQTLVEVGADYVSERRDGNHRSEEEVFGHISATDGTDLSTRRRWREYQKANNLTIADDFKETWAKAEAQKKAGVTPGSGHDSRARREEIGRIAYQLEKRRNGR